VAHARGEWAGFQGHTAAGRRWRQVNLQCNVQKHEQYIGAKKMCEGQVRANGTARDRLLGGLRMRS